MNAEPERRWRVSELREALFKAEEGDKAAKKRNDMAIRSALSRLSKSEPPTVKKLGEGYYTSTQATG